MAKWPGLISMRIKFVFAAIGLFTVVNTTKDFNATLFAYLL